MNFPAWGVTARRSYPDERNTDLQSVRPADYTPLTVHRLGRAFWLATRRVARGAQAKGLCSCALFIPSENASPARIEGAHE